MREFLTEDTGSDLQVLSVRQTSVNRRYFVLSMAAIVLSIAYPVVRLQLLVLSLITALKWITSGIRNQIVILERRPNGQD